MNRLHHLITAIALCLGGVIGSGCSFNPIDVVLSPIRAIRPVKRIVSKFREPATPPPHVFISYTAPAEGDASLRLAVKDLIDIEGQVTSAGSQLLYETAKPATKDAACLRIARQRGVTIVGKTNLSEFAVGVSGCNEFFGTPINPIQHRRCGLDVFMSRKQTPRLTARLTGGWRREDLTLLCWAMPS